MTAEGSNPYAPPQDERDIVERAPQGPPGTITCTVLLEVSDMMAGIALTGGKGRWALPILFGLMGLASGSVVGTSWQLAQALGLGLLGWALWPLVYRASAQRSLANKSPAERTVTYSFSQEFVEVTSATSYSRFQWPAVHRFLEGRNTFIMYMGEVIVQVIPKRALRTDDVAALRSMLETHITPRKKTSVMGRVLAAWILLVVLFLAIWQFLSDR